MRSLRLTFLATSLAGSLITCILWLQSHRHRTEAVYTWAGRNQAAIVSENGTVLAGCLWSAVPSYFTRNGWEFDGRLVWEDIAAARVVAGHPFGWKSPTGSTGAADMAWFPIWLPALFMATPPAIWLWRRPKNTGRGFLVETTSEC